jgi:hypothetical protein
MDSLQFWLYVIIGVIYLISQVRKKSREQMPQGKPVSKPAPKTAPKTQTTTTSWKSERTSTESAPSQKPMTFEELLREITEGKTAKEPTYEPYKQPEYVDYDDEVVDEEEVLQEEAKEEVLVDYRKSDSIYKQFEDAKNYDYAANSLENTWKLENVDMKFGKFKEFEADSQRNLLDEYTRDLRDPDGFKKAVILSEILNRRHF